MIKLAVCFTATSIWPLGLFVLIQLGMSASPVVGETDREGLNITPHRIKLQATSSPLGYPIGVMSCALRVNASLSIRRFIARRDSPRPIPISFDQSSWTLGCLDSRLAEVFLLSSCQFYHRLFAASPLGGFLALRVDL
mgnify:CR=1 FL=1